MNRTRWSVGTFLLGVLLLLSAITVFAKPGETRLPTMEEAGAEIQLLTDDVLAVVAMTHAGDGSGRLFIVEQPGRIKIWDGDQVVSPAYLNIASKVKYGGERGLLGLAFHPDYASNGLFYVNYTSEPDGNTIVAEYRADPPSANQVNPATERILLEIPQPYEDHNAGDMAFSPKDDYLYIMTGDGGAGWIGDPENRAQSLDTLLGKVLRIDPNNNDTSDGLAYDIPPTNPFVDDPDARDEIWAYGLRNPWRFGFDRATGAMLIGDVGQLSYEEINLQLPNSPGGENYGWRLMEGSQCFNPEFGCYDPSLTLPTFEYGHIDGNCAVIAGRVYRGSNFPTVRGYYLFGDWCSGRLFVARLVNGEIAVNVWQNTTYNPAAFGEDEAGELYFASTVGLFDSAIYHFVAVP